jgi:hypothetical protein
MYIYKSHLLKFSVILLGAAFAITGCKKDGPPEIAPQVIAGNSTSSGVFITNEGNFQFGNASVSYFDFSTGTVTEDLFSVTNQTALGDVCQSMAVFNNKAYLVVNNSGKVEVCNIAMLKQEGVISGLGSPRYFLPVTNDKAYVTDLYAHAISVVDLTSNAVVKKIPCHGDTEQLTMIFGYAFVTANDQEYLYLVNTASDVLEDSIHISKGANSIRQDNHGKLWVACSSDSSANIHGALYRIDPAGRQVEAMLTFSSFSGSPSRLCSNGTNDTLYYLSNGVYQLPVASARLPAAALIPQGSRNYYGLGIDPRSGTIYVSDAIDYVQRGRIYRYLPDGTPVDYFFAGIIPGDFCFR